MLIEDAGEVLPYARKHLAEDTGPQVSRAVRKADVFPEPDWSAMVAAGVPGRWKTFALSAAKPAAAPEGCCP